MPLTGVVGGGRAGSPSHKPARGTKRVHRVRSSGALGWAFCRYRVSSRSLATVAEGFWLKHHYFGARRRMSRYVVYKLSFSRNGRKCGYVGVTEVLPGTTPAAAVTRRKRWHTHPPPGCIKAQWLTEGYDVGTVSVQTLTGVLTAEKAWDFELWKTAEAMLQEGGVDCVRGGWGGGLPPRFGSRRCAVAGPCCGFDPNPADRRSVPANVMARSTSLETGAAPHTPATVEPRAATCPQVLGHSKICQPISGGSFTCYVKCKQQKPAWLCGD